MSDTSKMTTLMALLKRGMNGAVTESMEKRGIVYPCNWGVSLPAIRKAAREFAPDHELARFLYRQQLRELQLAAFVVADPALLTEEELDFWAKGITNTELAENLAFSLLSYNPELAGYIRHNWLTEKAPFLLKYCGIMTFAGYQRKGNVDVKAIREVVELFADSRNASLRHAAENIIDKMKELDQSRDQI